MPINVSDLKQVVYDFIVNTIKEEYPDIDTTENSPIIDLLVKPLQAVIEPIIQHSNSMEFMMNLDNAENMTEEDLDEIGKGNYMMERNPGEKAVGDVVFSFNSVSDTNNLIIPSGIMVSTKDGLNFITTTNYSFTPEELYGMYNPSTFKYEVPVSVVAEDVGSKYNVGEGTIVVITNKFSSALDSVTNKSAMTGGSDKESNKDFADRIRQFYISRQLGTKPGYKQFILEKFVEIKDVYIAGFGDDIMERDVATIVNPDDSTYTGHIGGKVDIYVRGSNINTDEQVVVCKSNNLPLAHTTVDVGSIQVFNSNDLGTELEFSTYVNASGKTVVTVPSQNASLVTQWQDGDQIQVDYTYDSGANNASETFTIDKTAITAKPPIVDILSILNDRVGSEYDLSGGDVYQINYLENSSSFQGTSKEVSEIEIIKSDAENGDSITISYSFNETIYKLDEVFNKDENRIITTDLLFKDATPIYIHLGMNIKLKEGVSGDASKESSIRNTLIEYLDNIGMGARMEESDIVSKLYVNESVMEFLEYVELPLLTFHKTENSSESYVAGTRDGTYLTLNKIEYPVLQFCKINYITS